MTHIRPGDRVRAPRSRIMVHVATFLRRPADRAMRADAGRRPDLMTNRL
jgi:hypothetical protein